QNAKTRRHDAARIARMDALAQHFDTEIADERAAQRCRHPELIVVATPAVEADDEPRGSDAIAEQVDVRGKIRRTALLIAFDDHGAKGGDLLLLDPLPGERNCLLHVAVTLPVGIEKRALIRNPDVLLQGGNDRAPPHLI